MLRNNVNRNVALAHYPLAIPFSPGGENSIRSFQDKFTLERGPQYHRTLRVFRSDFYGLFKTFGESLHFV